MIQLVIIGVYLSLLLALGLFSNRLFRGTSEDYMLASHSIGPFLLLMSLFGTTMTAFALVGSTGEAYKEGVGVYGMLASSSGIIHSLCFFVIGIKLWRIGRRHGFTTQIEFFRARLGNDTIGLLLFPVLVGLVIPYLLIGVMAAGTVINAITMGTFPEAFASYRGGVPPWMASMAICCVVLIYVFFGGMRGTAWANAFQTMFFMVLGMITFYIIAMKLGGTDSLVENMQKASAAVSEEKLTRGHLPKMMFFTYMLIPLSVGMFPHLFQHWLTAKSAESFKLPVVAHPIFIMIVWAPCVLIGVWATTELANVPPTVSPNGVLAFLVRTKTGNVLGGFLTAGVLAAIMSSLDSQFLCLGTIFTNDIALHYSKHITDRQRVITARVFVIVIVIVTYLFSLAEPRRVFQMGVWCFSGFSSLFPLIVAALYWRRLTLAGAYAAILAAMASWGYLFWQSDFAKIPNYSVDIKLGGEVYQTMPVATILLCSLVAMVAVSLLTRPPDKKVLDQFFPGNSS
jgi:SSS family solute:Na+ symporter